MTNQHPITPPPELVWEWTSLANEEDGDEVWISITTQAARWGADQELDACCEVLHLRDSGYLLPSQLRAARRPKPPSLKEQALTALSHLLSGSAQTLDTTEAEFYIRRALEALPND
jgi:hypothetical protein